MVMDKGYNFPCCHTNCRGRRTPLSRNQSITSDMLYKITDAVFLYAEQYTLNAI